MIARKDVLHIELLQRVTPELHGRHPTLDVDLPIELRARGRCIDGVQVHVDHRRKLAVEVAVIDETSDPSSHLREPEGVLDRRVVEPRVYDRWALREILLNGRAPCKHVDRPSDPSGRRRRERPRWVRQDREVLYVTLRDAIDRHFMSK